MEDSSSYENVKHEKILCICFLVSMYIYTYIYP